MTLNVRTNAIRSFSGVTTFNMNTTSASPSTIYCPFFSPILQFCREIQFVAYVLNVNSIS